MMPLSLLILLLCNFVTIGLLPLLFFRNDGTYNLRWLLTALPFFVTPIILVGGAVGAIGAPAFDGGLVATALQILAVPISVLSIALIAMTVGVHRIPLALWHQDNDDAVELITFGPYAHVRHPFYTSFILAMIASLLAFPHVAVFALLVYTFAALDITARREEKNLSASEFGADYLAYIGVSGRFFPRFGS